MKAFDARASRAAPITAVSRLYGGIHFRLANEDGLQAPLRRLEKLSCAVLLLFIAHIFQRQNSEAFFRRRRRYLLDRG
jgi:hypothetical protein